MWCVSCLPPAGSMWLLSKTKGKWCHVQRQMTALEGFFPRGRWDITGNVTALREASSYCSRATQSSSLRATLACPFTQVFPERWLMERFTSKGSDNHQEEALLSYGKHIVSDLWGERSKIRQSLEADCL